jgi:crossover junction endodeoxyribonuclease RusA
MSDHVYSITLPYPPSVNGYWRNIGRGRTIISKAGRDYMQAVSAEVAASDKPATYNGRLAVCVTVYPPDRRRRDLDNVCKAILDSLGKANVYEDDSQIDRLTIERAKVVRLGRVEITIEPIG